MHYEVLEWSFLWSGAASVLHFCLSALTDFTWFYLILLYFTSYVISLYMRIRLAVVSVFSIFGWLRHKTDGIALLCMTKLDSFISQLSLSSIVRIKLGRCIYT